MVRRLPRTSQWLPDSVGLQHDSRVELPVTVGNRSIDVRQECATDRGPADLTSLPVYTFSCYIPMALHQLPPGLIESSKRVSAVACRPCAAPVAAKTIIEFAAKTATLSAETATGSLSEPLVSRCKPYETVRMLKPNDSRGVSALPVFWLLTAKTVIRPLPSILDA